MDSHPQLQMKQILRIGKGKKRYRTEQIESNHGERDRDKQAAHSQILGLQSSNFPLKSCAAVAMEHRGHPRLIQPTRGPHGDLPSRNAHRQRRPLRRRLRLLERGIRRLGSAPRR